MARTLGMSDFQSYYTEGIEILSLTHKGELCVLRRSTFEGLRQHEVIDGLASQVARGGAPKSCKAYCPGRLGKGEFLAPKRWKITTSTARIHAGGACLPGPLTRQTSRFSPCLLPGRVAGGYNPTSGTLPNPVCRGI